MTKRLNALPYRRLKMMANGIWDEAKQEFYIFKPSVGTLSAKRGIHYFIKSCQQSAVNAGDHAVGSLAIQITFNGSLVYITQGWVPVTVAASNVNAGCSIYNAPCILCDPGTPVTVVHGGTTNGTAFTYAEIPSDPSGGPVVIT